MSNYLVPVGNRVGAFVNGIQQACEIGVEAVKTSVRSLKEKTERAALEVFYSRPVQGCFRMGERAVNVVTRFMRENASTIKFAAFFAASVVGITVLATYKPVVLVAIVVSIALTNLVLSNRVIRRM